ncbi:MAG: hypothetical protein R3F38_08545 [Gammaproteobacteria bacterium]
MESVKADMKEGWKEGMIEGAYLFNTNLNPLDIDGSAEAKPFSRAMWIPTSPNHWPGNRHQHRRC